MLLNSITPSSLLPNHLARKLLAAPSNFRPRRRHAVLPRPSRPGRCDPGQSDPARRRRRAQDRRRARRGRQRRGDVGPGHHPRLHLHQRQLQPRLHQPGSPDRHLLQPFGQLERRRFIAGSRPGNHVHDLGKQRLLRPVCLGHCQSRYLQPERLQLQRHCELDSLQLSSYYPGLAVLSWLCFHVWPGTCGTNRFLYPSLF